MAVYLCELNPELRSGLRRDVLTVQVVKAVYGLVESAMLWYKFISNILIILGYNECKSESCVFVRKIDGNISYITLYVDDLLICASSNILLDEIINALKSKEPNIKVNKDKVLSYLGMTIDLQVEGYAKISSLMYIETLMTKYEVIGIEKYPSDANLLTINESERLSGDEFEIYRSCVMSIMYLAKRVRPDLLFVVNFLAKRIHCSTKDDNEKLMHNLRYINGTKTMGINFNAVTCEDGVKRLIVKVYIDAAYALHENFKSHSGLVVMVSQGCIKAISTSQDTVCKSPCEAEIIALSDHGDEYQHAEEFIKDLLIDQYKVIIMEDNKSAIKLLLDGSLSRSNVRYIAIRCAWIEFMVSSRMMNIEFCSTKLMIANYLSKLIFGVQFHNGRRSILNTPLED
jgi:hypothetical protein